jgi:uncharacterized protein (TIGR03435 family)
VIRVVAVVTVLAFQVAQPTFEVASVKRNTSGASSASFGTSGPGSNLTVTNNTMRNIIRNTWTLQNYQIVGGPDWINNDRWDITAKPPEAASRPTFQEMMLMMRALLADRFKLVVHHEKREMPVYAIVLARADGKFGPQLRRTQTDCAEVAALSLRGQPVPPPQPGVTRPFCGTRQSSGTLNASGIQIADFARNLSGATGRFVIDKTGLTGHFDMDLKFTPDQLQSAAGNDAANEFPSLFAAIQEQLGLKLEAQRAPVDVLVIDAAQRAEEN